MPEIIEHARHDYPGIYVYTKFKMYLAYIPRMQQKAHAARIACWNSHALPAGNRAKGHLGPDGNYIITHACMQQMEPRLPRAAAAGPLQSAVGKGRKHSMRAFS